MKNLLMFKLWKNYTAAEPKSWIWLIFDISCLNQPHMSWWITNVLLMSKTTSQRPPLPTSVGAQFASSYANYLTNLLVIFFFQGVNFQHVVIPCLENLFWSSNFIQLIDSFGLNWSSITNVNQFGVASSQHTLTLYALNFHKLNETSPEPIQGPEMLLELEGPHTFRGIWDAFIMSLLRKF